MIKLTFATLLRNARDMRDGGVTKTERRHFLSGMRIGARFYTADRYRITLANGKTLII